MLEARTQWGEADWLKAEVRAHLESAQCWLTAAELGELAGLVCSDPLREIKKKIEELREEGCPIVSLPGKPGPGYLWIGDPDAPGAQEIVRMYSEDMEGRMRRMVKHLARIKRVTERRVQEEMFGEKGEGGSGNGEV